MAVVIHEKVVVVCGSEDMQVGRGWVCEYVEHADRKFIRVGKTSYKFREICGGNLDMFEVLLKKRNDAVRDAMIKECGVAEGSDAAVALPKRPRKQMIDEVPKIIDVKVELESGGSQTVAVLSHWCEAGMLEIELSKESVQLLREAPASSEQAFTPNISDLNVKWKPSTSSVYTRFYDGTKWRQKTMRVSVTDDRELMQTRVDKIASVMQAFFNVQHCDGRADDDAGEDCDPED